MAGFDEDGAAYFATNKEHLPPGIMPLYQYMRSGFFVMNQKARICKTEHSCWLEWSE
jgi:hypothetical protein